MFVKEKFLADEAFAPPTPLPYMSAKIVSFFWTAPLTYFLKYINPINGSVSSKH